MTCPDRPSAHSMTCLPLLLVLLAQPTALLNAQIKVEYDRFSNLTELSAPEIRLAEPAGGGEDPGLTMKAACLCPGDSLCKPEVVMLMFASRSDSWRFRGLRDLVLLSDESRFKLGELDHDGTTVGTTVLEVMSVLVPFDTFAAIANAEKLEGRLGLAEFQLSHEARLPLRHLLEKTQP